LEAETAAVEVVLEKVPTAAQTAVGARTAHALRPARMTVLRFTVPPRCTSVLS
jgi:hypothetical protein